MHDRLADFEIIGVCFIFNAALSPEEFDILMVRLNMTPSNWGVLFEPNAGVSLEFYKESVGVNDILCTDCEECNRLGLFKSFVFLREFYIKFRLLSFYV